jgi:hypothetical protein
VLDLAYLNVRVRSRKKKMTSKLRKIVLKKNNLISLQHRRRLRIKSRRQQNLELKITKELL